MPKSGQTVAEANRQIRQEDLRERITASGLLTHALNNIGEMQDLARPDRPVKEEDEFRLKALTAATDRQLKLLNKLVPDARELEIKSSGEVPVVMVLDYTGMDNPEVPDEHQVEGEVIENE